MTSLAFEVFQFNRNGTVGYQHLDLADGWYWRRTGPDSGVYRPVGPFPSELLARANAKEAAPHFPKEGGAS